MAVRKTYKEAQAALDEVMMADEPDEDAITAATAKRDAASAAQTEAAKAFKAAKDAAKDAAK